MVLAKLDIVCENRKLFAKAASIQVLWEWAAMIPSRRLPVLIGMGFLGIALVGLCRNSADAQKQPPIPQPVPASNAAGFSSVRIIEDTRIRRVIMVGCDCIMDEEWNQAIEALQAVLNEKKDYYVQVAESDPANPKREITRWASAKFEANNLIASMPPKGLQAYELAHGKTAKKMLEDARKDDDRERLADVAMRFRHTKAGAQANKILAKSAVLDALKVDGWPSWRGNVTNTGQATGGTPLLDKKLWSRPIFMDKLDGFNDQDPDDDAQACVTAAVKQVSDLKQPVLPGSFPIASQGIMVYRTQRDIRAVALKEIDARDDELGEVVNIKPGQLLWKSLPMDRSLAVLLEKNTTRAKVKTWLDAFQQAAGFNSFLYDNTVIGTLATDGRNVYAINDLAVPPHPGVFMQNPFNPQMNQLNMGDMRPLLMQNELIAYDLVNGKMVWDLNQNDPAFKDSHFLSLPISVGGKLYVLNERLIDPNQADKPNPLGGGMINPISGESELRLICIDPNKIVQLKTSPKPTVVAPIQVLANVVLQNRMVQDIGRRVNAIQLAYSDGVLVCPTNAGEVFGIDLRTRTLAWSYPYRETAHQPIVLPSMMLLPQAKGNVGTTVISKWKSAPPTIQDGKIVFTAPDADSVHCINLRDGRPAWRNGQQKGDLYMAGVFEGRVVIVGAAHIRALDLKNGSQLWSLHTGDLPSGQGVASRGIYYLPLKKEILAVDIVKGEVKAHIRGGAGGVSPGNLVFYENMVLSQTPTEVTAYPQLNAKDL
jgi:outer membrane protein assembly factor BamB